MTQTAGIVATTGGVPGFGPRRRGLASPLLAAVTALAPQGTSGRSRQDRPNRRDQPSSAGF
jgi:hypothetical protein